MVARPDEKWGETPCAYITLKAGYQDTRETEIILFCREHLAGFKLPKTVVFSELPKTSTGKIQKYLLRDWAKAYKRALDQGLFSLLVSPGDLAEKVVLQPGYFLRFAAAPVQPGPTVAIALEDPGCDVLDDRRLAIFNRVAVNADLRPGNVCAHPGHHPFWLPANVQGAHPGHAILNGLGPHEVLVQARAGDRDVGVGEVLGDI